MRKFLENGSLSGLVALLTFVLFAISILFVLLNGAGVYRRLTQRDQYSYDSRTCAQYVATKMRQAPSPAAISTDTFGTVDSLRISQDIEGLEFVTRIYCYENWLMEIFTLADGDFFPEDGEKILPLSSLSVSQDGSVFSFILTDTEGNTQHLTISARGGDSQ
jgi:hypothetical protein